MIVGKSPCEQRTVVEKYIPLLKFAEDSLLFVLFDWVSNFVSSNFILFSAVVIRNKKLEIVRRTHPQYQTWSNGELIQWCTQPDRATHRENLGISQTKFMYGVSAMVS